MIDITWDLFFYYDSVSVDDILEYDMQKGLNQGKRSLFYFRQYGAGVQESENMPNTLGLYIGLRYEIVKWVAYRNGYISNGNDGLPDRRIACSQNYITINQEGGKLDVDVFYIPFKDYNNPKNIRAVIG